MIPGLEFGCWWLQAVQRDRQGRRWGSAALYIKKRIKYGELSLKNGQEPIESLWVRVREWDKKRILVVGVCYRPPDEAEPFDEAFFLQLQEVWQSWVHVLLGESNHCDICWKSSMVSCRLLEFIKDNILSQMIDSPTRGMKYWPCSVMQVDWLLTSGLEAAWAAVIVQWQNSYSWGTWDRQRLRSGSWILEKPTSSSLGS